MSPEAELVVVLDRSGDGKSTAALALRRRGQPGRGLIHVAGQDLSLLNEAEHDAFMRRSAGWVFQAAGLLPRDLADPGEPEAAARATARRALSAMGLTDP